MLFYTMQYGQKFTNPIAADKPVDKSENGSYDPAENYLSAKQRLFIDYCARSGLLVTDDGRPRHQTHAEFAEEIGVSRQTLYNWKARIPHFMDMVVAETDNVIKEYISHTNKAIALQSMKGNIGAAKLLLQQAKKLQSPPKEVKEVQITGLADIVAELTDI